MHVDCQINQLLCILELLGYIATRNCGHDYEAVAKNSMQRSNSIIKCIGYLTAKDIQDSCLAIKKRVAVQPGKKVLTIVV